MVAGMAAPAYAGTYYIGDGDITITKDEKGDVYVKHADNKDKSKGDVDNGDIIIKGGTSANSPLQSASATLKVEDSENEDMVYPGDTKGSDSSDGGGEENETQSTEKDQTGDTSGSSGGSGSESGGSGSGGSDTKGDDTSGSEGDTTGNEENKTQSGDTTGSRTLAKGTESTESSSPAPESQFTYTGAPLKVAAANDDEKPQTESTTVLERAAETFTKNVIRIINNFIGNSSSKADNTLNVTLDNVNIKSNDAALSVEGAGDTTITLRGSNTLTNDLLHAGLEHNEKSEDGSYTGKLTITSEKDADGNDTGT
mgnify:FL=1